MRVAEFIRSRQLAILPDVMRSLRESADRGEALQESAARPATVEEAGPARIAIMPMFGMITQHMPWYGTGTEAFGREFVRIVNDPTFATIIIEANSPGGEVFGTPELANLVFQSREKKRVITHVNSMAASAMYWIGSAASEVVITPSGEVGSIGVLTWHEDVSKFEDNLGWKTELIAVPEAKIEGHPFAPLPDDVRQRIRGELTETHQAFMAAVAKHRGVTPKTVQNGFGQGRMVRAKAAVEEGMADSVMTLRELLDREIALLRKKSTGRAYADAVLRVTEAMK